MINEDLISWKPRIYVYVLAQMWFRFQSEYHNDANQETNAEQDQEPIEVDHETNKVPDMDTIATTI